MASETNDIMRRIAEVRELVDGKIIHVDTMVMMVLLALEAKEQGLTHKDFFKSNECYSSPRVRKV